MALPWERQDILKRMDTAIKYLMLVSHASRDRKRLLATTEGWQSRSQLRDIVKHSMHIDDDEMSWWDQINDQPEDEERLDQQSMVSKIKGESKGNQILTAVPPSIRGERTPPDLDRPPPSATTPNPSVAIQNLPGGPWPGPARKTSSKSAQDRASDDDARSSPFLATPRDRIRNGKNQRRPWLVRKGPGLCPTEPTRGLQQKYRRSERSSLCWRPSFGLAGGSGCTRAHSFSYVGHTIQTTANFALTLFYGSYYRACKSSFVENDLAVVEIDDDDLVGGRTHTPCSIPSGTSAALLPPL
ncbi:hypothetical protein PAXRUDRAFT_17004 [Paxillus rubicundulus Ve08.2h10]|uniref:Unplaced genomic scaffold scaffold_2805, whole genome shotgun sequence n=1 Tax=Paxillus rubicundulus Ve08.2h10 TaxID=930991 RepID=A0A0D0CY85_9AGAM|nr:hypothetical protein PAXRUDRAFT_18389 [Paxillus rubicundulus Ve08.2h10]KIK78207.1 hypothetical protein PAXRUDRAFT_17004 [Paxillus rubicundulus Ve08.2h10]